MKKSLLSLSLVASVVLFNGCGGSDAADTTAPKFTNVTTTTLDEGTSKTVTLSTDDNDAVFSGTGVVGNKLTYTAPLVDVDTSKTVVVTATDKAGNTSNQNFVFNIKDIPAAKSGYVASLGNKTFTRSGDDLKGASGLVWRDAIPDGTMTYNAAETFCPTGFRLPRPSEVLDLIDYVSTADANSTLLDDDFTNNIANDTNGNAIVSGVWVNTIGKSGNHHYVHLVGGVDALETADANHSVICVKGDGQVPGSSDLKVVGDDVQDLRTGYIWKSISASATAVSYASRSCPSGFELPNVNELRSIYDYATYKFPASIVPSGVSSLWTSTPDPKKANQNYIMQVDQNASLNVGFTNMANNTHHVICVKKP